MGGEGKELVRQAFFHLTTPPPPAKRIGGRGLICREKRRFCLFLPIIWRRGSPDHAMLINKIDIRQNNPRRRLSSRGICREEANKKASSGVKRRRGVQSTR